MISNFKDIHIGKLVRRRMQECDVTVERAAAFLKLQEEDIEQMYEQKSLDCEVLLRWSKLLEYDFFRIYTQHLILYAPQDAGKVKRKQKPDTDLPVFKKNIYMKEVIDYLIELVDSGQKTYKEIQDEYNIPSTTVFRWRDKYAKKDNPKTDKNEKK